jgi:hypothetical protein
MLPRGCHGEHRPHAGLANGRAAPVDPPILVPDSPTVRARSIVLVGAAAVVPLGLLTTSCGDDGGDTAQFCAEVSEHSAELTARPETLAELDSMLGTYRRIGADAPLAIEPHWEALVINYETASTVDVSDPESVQRALAQAYATERSAVAVHAYVATTCGADLGPVATVVAHPAPPAPPAAAAPATTAPSTDPGGPPTTVAG